MCLLGDCCSMIKSNLNKLEICLLIVFDFKNKKRRFFKRLIMVAGVGFEPHDLRVMSPTSDRAAPPRDIYCRAFALTTILV